MTTTTTGLHPIPPSLLCSQGGLSATHHHSATMVLFGYHLHPMHTCTQAKHKKVGKHGV
jgi:hypothetical protein